MSRRRPRLTETQEQANSPVEAGGSDMRPEPATAAAARSRGRAGAKVRKIAATPTVDDDHTGQDTTKSKGVARVPRRRGKLRQMLDMPLEIIMEVSSFNLVLRGICLMPAYVDMRSSSTQRYPLCIQTVESVPRVLHPSKCPVLMEVCGAQRSWPTTMPPGS